MAVNIHITIIELNALHTKRPNLFHELDAVIHLLMEAKHWGLRKSRNATRINSRPQRLALFPYTTLFRSMPPAIRDARPTIRSQAERVRSSSARLRIVRSEEHTSELQSHSDIVCRLLLEKKHLLMKAKHWRLRKSRNATSVNSRFHTLDTV